MECKYHNILKNLHEALWLRIDNYYNWEFFDYWLGDESNLGGPYKETFEEILQEPLTEAQNTLLEKKGGNLETMIGKWCSKWHANNPGLQGQKMPKSCLKVKMYEYIVYQLNRKDLKELVGTCC